MWSKKLVDTNNEIFRIFTGTKSISYFDGIILDDLTKHVTNITGTGNPLILLINSCCTQIVKVGTDRTRYPLATREK